MYVVWFRFQVDSATMITYTPRKEFMEIALKEAIACRAFDEHPVGAVIVQGHEIISQSGNRTHRDTNPTHHAEVVVIGLASHHLGQKNLSDCILYTTHEPCPMCAAASIYARIGGIVFGTSVDDAARFVEKHPQVSWRSIGVSLSLMRASGDAPLFVIEGFMRRQCASLFSLLLDGASPAPLTSVDGVTFPSEAAPGCFPSVPETIGMLNHEAHVLPHPWPRTSEERQRMA
jgi:tRNA(Arg) A34 adenosine deaminase TadA